MPKLVYRISEIGYRKINTFLILISFFLISHISYLISPTYAAIREIPDCEPEGSTPVTANIESHEKYLDLESKALIYSGINEEIENNPQNSKPICPGISQENWLTPFLRFTCSFLPTSGFCSQALSLGKNTVVLDSKFSTFKDANVYPNLKYEKQPSNVDVIRDTTKDQIGDEVISAIVDSAGKNPASFFMAGYPDKVYIEDNPTPVMLADKLDENAALTQGGKIETERTGQLCPAQSVNFSGMFYPGFIPQGFEECAGLVPQVSAGSSSATQGEYIINVYIVQGPETTSENTPQLTQKAQRVIEETQNFYTQEIGKTFKRNKIEFVNAPTSLDGLSYKNEEDAEILRKIIFGDSPWPANQISVIIVNGNITNALGFAQGFVKGEGVYRKENDNKPGIITDSGAVVTDDYVYNYLKKCDTVGDYNCTQAMYTVAHELAHAFGLPHYTTECNLLYISAGCFVPKFTDIAKESLKNSPFLN